MEEMNLNTIATNEQRIVMAFLKRYFDKVLKDKHRLGHLKSSVFNSASAATIQSMMCLLFEDVSDGCLAMDIHIQAGEFVSKLGNPELLDDIDEMLDIMRRTENNLSETEITGKEVWS